METNEDLLRTGYRLKQEIAVRTGQLKEINQKIAALAAYKEGSKTGHIAIGNFSAKVTLSSTVKWDQQKLKQIMSHFSKFHDIFEPAYKPRSKKILDLACAADPELNKAVDWASETKQNAPSVTYELIEEVPNA